MLARRDRAERLHRDRRFAQRELRGSTVPNFRRWTVLDRRIWPNPVARGSHTAEVRYLRGWLKRRIAWIDRNVA